MDKQRENIVLAIFMAAIMANNKLVAAQIYKEHNDEMSEERKQLAKTALAGLDACDKIMQHIEAEAEAIIAEALGAEHTSVEQQATKATSDLLNKFKLH